MKNSKKLHQLILSLLFIFTFGIIRGEKETLEESVAQPTESTQQQVPVGEQGATNSGKLLDAPDPKNILAQLLNGNDDIKKLLEDLMQSQAVKIMKQQNELKAKALELLAEDPLAEKIRKAQSSYQTLVTSLNIERCFLKLCESIQKDIEQGQVEKSAEDAFSQHLDKLHASLLCGSFTNIIFPGQLLIDPNGIMGRFVMSTRDPFAKVFTPNDLKILIEKAESYDAACARGNKENLKTLITWLKLADDKNIKELCSQCIGSLASEFEEASEALSAAVPTLADFVIECTKKSKDSEQAYILSKGAKLWLDELRKYKETIVSFLSLYKRSQFDIDFLIKSLMLTHDICEPLFFFYRDEPDIFTLLEAGSMKLNLTNALDGALRFAIAASSFANQQGKTAEEVVQKCLLTDRGLVGFVNPLNQLEHQVSKFVTSSVLLWRPTSHSEQIPPLKKFLIRIVLVWVSYQSYVRYTRGYIPDAKDLDAKYGPLKAVCFETLKSLQYFLTGNVYRTVAHNFDPITLETIENYSLGLIKPDLIFELSDILFQVVFQHQYSDDAYLQKYGKMSNLVSFTNKDLFNYDLWFKYGMKLRRRRAGKTGEHDYESNYWDNVAEYAKYRLVTYAGKNIGTFCGREIAGLFGNFIERWTLSILKWVSGAEGTYEDFETQMTMPLTMLKGVTMLVFEPHSQERTMLVDYMKNLGIFKDEGFADENLKDPKSVNYAILAVVMSYLVSAQLLTHLEYSQFLNMYSSNPHGLAFILDDMFIAAKNNMTRAAGGIVGSCVGRGIAQVILWNHIPVYHDAADGWESFKESWLYKKFA